MFRKLSYQWLMRSLGATFFVFTNVGDRRLVHTVCYIKSKYSRRLRLIWQKSKLFRNYFNASRAFLYGIFVLLCCVHFFFPDLWAPISIQKLTKFSCNRLHMICTWISFNWFCSSICWKHHVFFIIRSQWKLCYGTVIS